MPLFSAEEFISYSKANLKIKKCIIIFQNSTLNYFIKKYHAQKIPLKGLFKIYRHKHICLVRVKGIGAPNAVAVFEEMIALGGKEFIVVGTAGGLQDFGTFLCTKAIRDEGTSHHYVKHGTFSYPDNLLTERLGKNLKKNKIAFERGASWTIDAPYRETKKEIEHYRKQGIATVEMEASALFAVAKIRKVNIAAVFVVSDVLGKKWNPQFHSGNLKKKLNKVFDASFKCLQ